MLKCIGIIMVVVGHTACPIHMKAMFYFIHMPLFFLISGMTCRENAYFTPPTFCYS
ncbi:MAG: hypothetical protein IKZ62_03810 [Prevotella sp.]|nr:hypothetical protein [Prevotella sp.]